MQAHLHCLCAWYTGSLGSLGLDTKIAGTAALLAARALGAGGLLDFLEAEYQGEDQGAGFKLRVAQVDC